MSVFSTIVFNPGFSRFVSALNNEKSMFSIAVRDGVDNTGRAIQETKRSRHGGRERLLEDVATLLIWGFGISFLKKQVYDRFAKKWLKHPDIDTGWVEKLDANRIKTFAERHPGAYDGVLEALTNPSLMRKYKGSNWLKLALCTGIPVAVIAFGIPTFNQWLTRRIIAQEKAAGNPVTPTLEQHSFGNNPFAISNSRKPAFWSVQTPPGRYGMPFAQTPQPFQMPLMVPNRMQNRVMPNPMMAPRFGLSTGQLASTLIQQERYNTMIMDGVISGGRIGKARNSVERFEQFFKESWIVFFLYIAQSPIQKAISSLINKIRGVDSSMSPDVLDHLWRGYKDRPDAVAGFSADVARSNQWFHQKGDLPGAKALNEDGLIRKSFKWLTFRKNKINRPDTATTAHMQQAIEHYFLEGKTGNLVIDSAVRARAIPTFEHNGQKLLDFTKAIETDKVLGIAHQLESFATKAESTGLLKVLKRSKGGMVMAMLAANAVCAFALSYAVPKLQHYITFLMTGRDYFPGVDPAPGVKQEDFALAA